MDQESASDFKKPSELCELCHDQNQGFILLCWFILDFLPLFGGNRTEDSGGNKGESERCTAEEPNWTAGLSTGHLLRSQSAGEDVLSPIFLTLK